MLKLMLKEPNIEEAENTMGVFEEEARECSCAKKKHGSAKSAKLTFTTVESEGEDEGMKKDTKHKSRKANKDHQVEQPPREFDILGVDMNDNGDRLSREVLVGGVKRSKEK